MISCGSKRCHGSKQKLVFFSVALIAGFKLIRNMSLAWFHQFGRSIVVEQSKDSFLTAKMSDGKCWP
jgi:hypothetical protein